MAGSATRSRVRAGGTQVLSRRQRSSHCVAQHSTRVTRSTLTFSSAATTAALFSQLLLMASAKTSGSRFRSLGIAVSIHSKKSGSLIKPYLMISEMPDLSSRSGRLLRVDVSMKTHSGWRTDTGGERVVGSAIGGARSGQGVLVFLAAWRKRCSDRHRRAKSAGTRRLSVWL